MPAVRVKIHETPFFIWNGISKRKLLACMKDAATKKNVPCINCYNVLITTTIIIIITIIIGQKTLVRTCTKISINKSRWGGNHIVESTGAN
jgi:hypothetical protein